MEGCSLHTEIRVAVNNPVKPHCTGKTTLLRRIHNLGIEDSCRPSLSNRHRLKHCHLSNRDGLVFRGTVDVSEFIMEGKDPIKTIRLWTVTSGFNSLCPRECSSIMSMLLCPLDCSMGWVFVIVLGGFFHGYLVSV